MKGGNCYKVQFSKGRLAGPYRVKEQRAHVARQPLLGTVSPCALGETSAWLRGGFLTLIKKDSPAGQRSADKEFINRRVVGDNSSGAGSREQRAKGGEGSSLNPCSA